MTGAISRLYRFYRDGFASMTLGRVLWRIVIIKLVILFGVVKLFFMPDFLSQRCASDREKAGYVSGRLLAAAHLRAGEQTSIKGGER
jgi:hypothetical protein